MGFAKQRFERQMVIGSTGLLAMAAASLRAIEAKRPAQTATIDPEAPVPPPESRQVRRARERREAKRAR
jgi:hypothetical protein